MAAPTPYSLAYDFTAFQAANPTTPLPADKIEIEFNALEITTDEIITNLGLIQRGDGLLQNNIVTADAFASSALLLMSGFTPRGDYATATVYAVGDMVSSGGGVYVCHTAHTSSGAIDTSKFIEFTAGGTAENVVFTPAGGIAAITVQAAIEELDSEKTTLAGVVAANNAFTGDNSFAGKVSFKDDGERTISSGAISITGSNHTVDTQGDAATDDLDTISGSVDGCLLTLRPANTSRTIVLTDAGNIQLQSGIPVILDSTSRFVVLQYDLELTKWVVLAQPEYDVVNAIGSAGGGTQDIDLDLGRTVSVTVDTSTTTFTFSNPKLTGYSDAFDLYVTNGGSQTVNWPASVDWAGGTAPSLTAAGVDHLVFTTRDGGTTWYGYVAGLDMS
jgi:hypothetical protein